MGPSLFVWKPRAGARWARRIALVAVLALVPTGSAAAAPLSSDEPPMLGYDALAPTRDSNDSGMAEAFSFVAKEDGPVDVINVYLEAGGGHRLIAGIYDDKNGGPR